MRHYLKFTIFFITIILIIISGDKALNPYPDRLIPERDELRCAVNIEGGIYIRRGHTVGFHFELLKSFAEQSNSKIKISPAIHDSVWRDLANGKLDIVVIDSKKEEIPEEFQELFISGIFINENEDVWVVNRKDYLLLEHLNYWLSYYKQSKKYKTLVANYYRKYRSIRPDGGKVMLLSPYDRIIRENAKKISWDWRLLASLIYQESKFSLDAKSSRGAHGLMQIRKATADQFNVENIYDPEQNIMAGSLMIKRLERMFSAESIDSINRIKLTLAAYNAGEGRIEDCRNFARYKGINSNNWDSISSVIPLMRMEELPKDVVKLGRFKGDETIKFVDEIMERYEQYKILVKK